MRKDAKLARDWFLGGSGIADAQRFPAFSGGAVRKDAIDELRRKNADDIEIRLADQNLLPRFVDLSSHRVTR
ncbi:hypothetical protein LJ655_13915 [Paraburkholderia sp. MMS20-SJTN17]|uniref:Uncharacterized protein n=1 Tax=Paraburkholderia translucens TaxID=2886945 RepID=A0ABS8KDY6_9BURK|nr:hypothetical protein [Paraburkholderia sp. MMS20-SJTN17]MCC8402969.1 hypothetical protein [Paraburkholderia sp. MMS20-SJTN17]